MIVWRSEQREWRSQQREWRNEQREEGQRGISRWNEQREEGQGETDLPANSVFVQTGQFETSEEESFQRIGGRDVTFTMGSSQSEKDRAGEFEKHVYATQVEVIFSKAFEIMTTEVTQKMWFDVMKKNPSRFKTSDHCDNHLKIGEEDLCPDHPGGASFVG